MPMLTRELIEYVCSQHDDQGLVELLPGLLQKNGGSFSLDAAEALDMVLEARIEVSSLPLHDWINSLALDERSLPRYLYARFLVRQGNYRDAIQLFDALIKSMSKVDPFLLLHLVRLLVRTRQFSRAAYSLKLALSLAPPYSFMVRCEVLLKKILNSDQWQARQTIRLALLGSSTTSFLASVIQALCFRDGIHVVMHEGGFSNFRQDILDPTSTLYAFNPQAVILLLNHRDIGLSPLSQKGTAEKFTEDLRTLWDVLLKRNPCHLIQVGFDLPLYASWGGLEETQPGGRVRMIATINAMLAENLPPSVSFCSMVKVALRLGHQFHSEADWYSSRLYPSPEALPLLADHLTANLRAAFGYSAKVLVLDLDNTLWGGVIGEDGLSGIVIGPPSPEGECHLDLQHYVKELKGRGVLLAVCSKNNLDDAELPFREHDSMILRMDDFVLFIANWQDKASNIQEMATKLSLGLDSFVFLDDNPLERAWVRSRLPDVIVPECGSKPWEMLEALDHGMYFESIVLTEEDAERHKSYQSNIVRQEFETSAATVEEFLSGLEMVAQSGSIDSITLTRSTQLINKTNQFNLTSRRYSEEQIRSKAESPDWWTRWFRLTDKFGDHGLIGVILVKKSGTSWHIDTWLMSCRVLGRHMEKYMLATLLIEAVKEGVTEVFGEYIHTAKNSLVQNMFLDLGFQPGDRSNCFVFHINDLVLPVCEFIRGIDV
ncbi:MAG: HAD-IIIC family phosphatase [Chlorobiaceae bacterium]|nr:HAD-IIIC family phosphatase [Chlorobiaceae bacterium]